MYCYVIYVTYICLVNMTDLKPTKMKTMNNKIMMHNLFAGQKFKFSKNGKTFVVSFISRSIMSFTNFKNTEAFDIDLTDTFVFVK